MAEPDEIRLAAALAGRVSNELDGAVTKNTNKIDPQRFIRNLGVNYPKAGPNFNRQQTQAPQTHVPGMIQETKLTPAGSEIVGTASFAPDLIPIPPELEKYANEYLHESDGTTQTENPDKRLITEPAPVPTPLPNPSQPPSYERAVIDQLTNMSHILSNIERLLSEHKINQQGKKPKNRKLSSPKVKQRWSPSTTAVPTHEGTNADPTPGSTGN